MTNSNGLTRCGWAGTDPDYIRYHDTEWGVPLLSDRRFFEFLVLESAQAGLSWLTILRKRPAYRRAYRDFDPQEVAAFPAGRVETLKHTGIVANTRKIEASITNARLFLDLQAQFGSFARYIWRFVDFGPIVNNWQTLDQVPATSPLAEKITRDMKQRGFRFIGPRIIYAFLQATGIINDHLVSCFRYKELLKQAPRQTIMAALFQHASQET